MALRRCPWWPARTCSPHLESLEDRCLPRPAGTFGDLPLAFEANVGQAEAAVRYLAHGPGYTLALTDQGAALALTHAGRQDLLQLRFVGGSATPVVVGLEEQA